MIRMMTDAEQAELKAGHYLPTNAVAFFAAWCVLSVLGALGGIVEWIGDIGGD